MMGSSQISEDEALTMILASCPQFSKTWNEHLAYWAPDVPSIGLNVSAFSSYIADAAKGMDQGELARVFSVIEQLVTRGSTTVATAATTEFLENLQNLASNGMFDFARVVPVLGENSRAYCVAWDKFCGAKSPGL